MKTLLKLNTSIFGENGASSRLAEAFVARWLAAHRGVRVIDESAAQAIEQLMDASRLVA